MRNLAILQPAHFDPAKRAPLSETEQNLFHKTGFGGDEIVGENVL